MGTSQETGLSDSVNNNTTLRIRAHNALLGALLIAAAACAAAMILYGINPGILAATEVFLLLCMSLYIFYKKHQYSGAVEMINTTAAKIEDTQLQLTAFNDHLHTLNEFTKKLSEKTDKTEICKLVTRSLVNEFKYDSSQFWLFNSRKKRLECVSATGYNDDILNQLVDQKGAMHKIFLRVLSERKTLIVKDTNDPAFRNESDIDLFSQKLSLNSFVVTPLLVEEKSLGILTIEYQRDCQMDAKNGRTIEFPSLAPDGKMATGELKHLDDKDRLLLESIKNFVGDALVKIELFQDMGQQIEERTRKLKKINAELLITRELAIQNEKLSSLGRMAAGVVHEINDPLNFLVNILPELRRDIQGLVKAKELIQECVTDQSAVSEIEMNLKEFDLDSHLQEMDFVFDRVSNALNKSARIARSLNVFTSGDSKYETVSADLLEVAQDTIDIISNKVLGETKIIVITDIPCFWRINISEMQQVFINLINNAVEAMEQNGTIEIRGQKAVDNIIIYICDNGPGIPEEVIDQIFNPFFTTKPAGQSTGLGLSISAEIVQKFGGNLTVESEEGKGTCFKLLFEQP